MEHAWGHMEWAETQWAQGHKGHPGLRDTRETDTYTTTQGHKGTQGTPKARTHTRPCRNALGHKGHSRHRDTPGTGIQRTQWAQGTLGDAHDVWTRRAQPGAGHAGMRRHSATRVPRMSPVLGWGLTGCPLAPTAGPGCWASVPFTAIPSRSAQHRPRGLWRHAGATAGQPRRGGHGEGGPRRGGHGEGATAGGYAAHPMVPLSAQHRAASRAGPCGTAASAQSSGNRERDQP